ncbi:MAG: cation-transporting P-type ATPase [Nitrospirota bacterium]
MNWHNKDTREVFEILESSSNGLSSQEALEKG